MILKPEAGVDALRQNPSAPRPPLHPSHFFILPLPSPSSSPSPPPLLPLSSPSPPPLLPLSSPSSRPLLPLFSPSSPPLLPPCALLLILRLPLLRCFFVFQRWREWPGVGGRVRRCRLLFGFSSRPWWRSCSRARSASSRWSSVLPSRSHMWNQVMHCMHRMQGMQCCACRRSARATSCRACQMFAIRDSSRSRLGDSVMSIRRASQRVFARAEVVDCQRCAMMRQPR